MKIGPAFEPSELHDLLLLLQMAGVAGPLPELHEFNNLQELELALESRLQAVVQAFSAEQWTGFKAQLADFHQPDQNRSQRRFVAQGRKVYGKDG